MKDVLEGLLMRFVLLLQDLYLLLSMALFFVNYWSEVFARRDAAWFEGRIMTYRQIQRLFSSFRLLEVGIKINLSIGGEQVLMRTSDLKRLFLMLLLGFLLLFFLFGWTLSILELFIFAVIDL